MGYMPTQQLLLLASVVLATVSGSRAIINVGTAAYYSSPYIPTDCYGDDPSQLPPSDLFAAAGSDLWDNGVACGRVYEVRCVAGSPSVPSSCGSDRPILVKIIDNALSVDSAAAAYKQSVTGATLILSKEAFNATAKPFAGSINIEFQEVEPIVGLSRIASVAEQKTVQRTILLLGVSMLIQMLLFTTQSEYADRLAAAVSPS